MTAELSVMRGPVVKLPREPQWLLHRIFEASSHRCGLQGALFGEYDAETPILTFAQLDAAATRLARALLRHVQASSQSRGEEHIIGVSLAPGAPLIITLLATWKAGAAYMPVEPGIPPQRAAHILADSTPLFVIAETDVLQPHAPVLIFSELEREAAELSEDAIPDEDMLQPDLEDTERVAAVLYTSGSTGAPKGVKLPHRAVLNRLRWQWREFPFTDEEHTCVFKTALSFVDSVGEMFAPLLQGRALALLPRAAVGDPERLVAALKRHEIRRLVLVPSLLRALLLVARQPGGAQSLKALKLWVCSGEELALELVTEFFQTLSGGVEIANFYGSTEVMGDVTYFSFRSLGDVKEVASYSARAPIGRALDNTAIILLDSNLQPVPCGEQGELYAAGLNVALGYLNNRDPGRFITNPHTSDPDYSVLYHTGDYARILNGQLIYEGRSDAQIKVRGNRVDLSEVERALRNAPDVEKAVVLCYKPGRTEQAILGFVTTNELTTVAQLETSLQSSLASYMMPQLSILDSIPLLVNGKTDRQLLLQRFEQELERRSNDQTARLDLSSCPPERMAAAEILLSTVRSVLGASLRSDVVSLEGNFYQLGGNSLNSVFTISRLQEQGYQISISEFVSAPTLGDVLQRMRDAGEDVEEAMQCGAARAAAQEQKYTCHPLCPETKEAVYRMITASFYEKADLERWLTPPPSHPDYHALLDALWPHLLRTNLSFTVRSVEDGREVGVSLNFDAHAEPEIEVHSQLSIVFEFLESLEGPIRDTKLVAGPGAVLHSFMLGTEPSMSPAENVEVTEVMEMEGLRIAREGGFRGVFTTNTSPLTQQLCTDVYGYQVLLDYQVNAYVAPDGSKPFGKAPDSQRAVCGWRKV